MADRHMISNPNPVGFGTCGQNLPAALDLTSPSTSYGAERTSACCLGDRADFTERRPALVPDPFNGRRSRDRFGKDKP